MAGDFHMLGYPGIVAVFICFIRRENIGSQCFQVHKQIAPHAFAPFAGAGSVGLMPGDDKHITGGKGHPFVFKIDIAAVGMAKADFHDVVEMQTA